MIDFLDVLERIKPLVIEVGTIQQQHLGKNNLQMHTKSSGIDLVTEIDKKSEEIIVGWIKQRYPEHSILAEESGMHEEQSDYLWIIDPLDGTTNYAQGLPIFAVSIALQYRRETMFGIVYAPAIGQMFTAIKGQGAYLNGEQRLQVTAKTELLQCVLATGFPYDIGEHPVNNLDYFSHILPQTRAVRRLGAAAYDLSCVAAGKFDGYWELKLSPWDVAAGVLIVEEAGGKVVPFRDDRGVSIIAGNPVICQKIYDEIQAVNRAAAK